MARDAPIQCATRYSAAADERERDDAMSSDERCRAALFTFTNITPYERRYDMTDSQQMPSDDKMKRERARARDGVYYVDAMTGEER